MTGKKLENKFQGDLIKELHTRFPEAIVLKNDAGYLQGIPDLLILDKDRWAALEVKKGDKAKRQPNQDYYVDKMDNMSYAAFITPENKEEVLSAIQQSFGARRKTRVSKRQ